MELSIERTWNDPNCILCGAPGEYLYKQLPDRLYHTKGHWNTRKCTNNTCQLLWLDPKPDEGEIWKAYTSYYTHSDAGSVLDKIFAPLKQAYIQYKYKENKSFKGFLLSSAFYFLPTERSLADIQFLYLNAGSGQRLLDVGSGSGEFLQRVHGLGYNVQGIDLDPKSVQFCQEKGLSVNQGDLLSQKFEAETFDIVTINNVIEHVYNPKEVLAEVYRILKPGGQLVIATPNTKSILYRRLEKSYWFHLDPPRHLYLFNNNNLASEVSKAGLQITKSFSSSRNDFWVFMAGQMMRKDGMFYLERKSKWLILVGKLIQLYIQLVNYFTKTAGGETVIIATK